MFGLKDLFMQPHEASSPGQGLPALQWVPLHQVEVQSPIALCVLLNPKADKGDNPFVLLREGPGSQVYLGGIWDAAGRVQQWLEVWVQEAQLKSPSFGAEAKPLDNSSFDRQWRREFERLRDGLGEAVL